jgi:hypothetical protein
MSKFTSHALKATVNRRLNLTSAFAVALFLSSGFSAAAHATENLQRGLVITDSGVLKALEKKGFALSDLVTGTGTVGIQSNGSLATVPAFKSVIDNLAAEMAEFKKKNPKAGVGMAFGQRLFDLEYLKNGRARFALAGVINRMDQGYKTGNRCGEVRFIYRLAYSVKDKGADVTSRLPMTINMVMNAGTTKDQSECAELAQAWSKVNPETVTSDDLIASGPLAKRFLDIKNVKSLEINLQMVRLAASARPDFGGHAEYLLKAYKKNANGAFQEAPLENQIDRARLLSDSALLAKFKKWILDPVNLKAIDAGTHLIPEIFLSKTGYSIAPGGMMSRSANRLFTDIFSSEELKSVRFSDLELVKSEAGLLRRLNDSTCVGCHQTRAIGGFHFTGRDPFGKYPGNSVFLPGSAHFMGDLARRRLVVEDIAQKKATIDYSRGFSSRPQERRSKEISGTGLSDGWGAHCTLTDDPSFKSWTCGAGLSCKALSDKESGMGICAAATQEVGDPCEFGKITTAGFGKETYKRLSKRTVTVPNAMCSPQSQDPGTKTGGFLNGNVRTLSCENLSNEAACGLLPASKPGFNSCVGKYNFGDCLKKFSLEVGMRGCDQTNPCRDDYICAEGVDAKRGVCISPYFLFQFRVDGHPKGE